MKCDCFRCRHFAVLFSYLVATVLVSLAGRPVHAATILNFDSLDASAPAGLTGAPVTAYFASFGVTISGDPLAVFDVRNFVDRGVEFTAPASRLNFLGGTKSPQTTTLHFNIGLESLSFTRNALIVTGPGGTTHPEWSATAYDAGGNALDTVGEALIATFTDIPLTPFTLEGPNIASVTFHSDNRNFAGYGAVILDDLTLRPVPEPSAFFLWSMLGFVAAAAGRRSHRDQRQDAMEFAGRSR